MDSTKPRCFGRYNADALVCAVCYAKRECRVQEGPSPRGVPHVERADPVEGDLSVEGFHLGYTLGSGQVFRWGRDEDGWWKGIAYGTALHLRQIDNRLRYRASALHVSTYKGAMHIEPFLRWYLRVDEPPRVRVPRNDRRLRKARDRLKGFRFVRQDPAECIPSYILSVQARMSLTKQRLNLLARLLGSAVDFLGQRYWRFPSPEQLGDLSEGYLRHQRFGWRAPWVVASARFVEKRLEGVREPSLVDWQAIVDELRTVRNSGLGLKVARCIDLFSLDRLNAVPVDTWVRKLCEEWYGLTGSDQKLCEWAEARGGKWGGYMNEYLFIYYRELHAPTIQDRILSFCESDEVSGELPFDR